MNKDEGEITPPHILREQRLASTTIPECFDFLGFIEGLRSFYQRVEIGFWHTGKNEHTFRWHKLTADLAMKYTIHKPLRIRLEDTSGTLDTIKNNEQFYSYITYELILLLISCFDMESIEMDNLSNLSSIIDRILDYLHIFPSTLHKSPLLSFCCFVELNLRSPYTSSSVIDLLRQSCIDCGIEVPDVLE